VRRARVWILNTNTQSVLRRGTITDQQGRFAFTSLPAGRFHVTAEKPAYVDGAAGARTPGGPGVPVALTDGEVISTVDIRLTPGAVVTGRVLSTYGAPAAGASVELSTRRMVDGQSVLRTSGRTTTNDLGQYRFFGLRPGRYVVVARPPSALGSGIVASAAEVQWAQRLGDSRAVSVAPAAARPVSYAPVAYPGVTDFDAAAEVTVGAGEERTDIDIPLQFVSTASIAGVVVGSDGAPSPNARVRLRLGKSQTGADGRFSFGGQPPGRYTLFAEAPGPSGTQFASATATLAGEDVANLVLTLQPGGTVEGRLVMDAQAGTTPLDQRRLGLRLQPLPGSATVTSSVPAIDADGRVRWTSVAPGSYRLEVSIAEAIGGEAWVVRSAMLAGRDVLDAPFTVEPAGVVEDLQVVLTDRVTELSGRLLDQADRPAPELFVIAFPVNPSLWHERSRWMREPAHPASDGRFVFTGLPAGEYYLAVLPTLEGEWREPAYLEQVVAGALRVTLVEGERRTHEIRLAR
jgi:protocatechuate 3,4-dioxygenase beta subunit